MGMELDIDVRFSGIQSGALRELDGEYVVERKPRQTSADALEDVIARAWDAARAVDDVDKEVYGFLNGLNRHADKIRSQNGVIRLGIFYMLEETVVFPLRLSSETIKLAGSMNLSFDVTGYPCSDESSEDG